MKDFIVIWFLCNVCSCIFILHSMIKQSTSHKCIFFILSLTVSSLPKKKSDRFLFDKVEKFKPVCKISAQSDQWCPSVEHLNLKSSKGSKTSNCCYYNTNGLFEPIFCMKAWVTKLYRTEYSFDFEESLPSGHHHPHYHHHHSHLIPLPREVCSIGVVHQPQRG